MADIKVTIVNIPDEIIDSTWKLMIESKFEADKEVLCKPENNEWVIDAKDWMINPEEPFALQVSKFALHTEFGITLSRLISAYTCFPNAKK